MRCTLAAVALAVAACGSSEPGDIQITFTPTHLGDTVETSMTPPIEIGVASDQDLTGTQLLVRVLLPPTGPVPMQVGRADNFHPADALDLSLPASGRVKVALKLWIVAGPARLEARLPAFDVADTLTYAIVPGDPVGVAMLLADTAMYVGTQVQLRGAVVDRHNNPRPAPVTYGTGATGLALSPTGVVSAQAIGRSAIEVSAMGDVDTAWISVVPSGTLLVSDVGGSGFAMLTLDGSERTPIREATDQGVRNVSGDTPSWNPSGTRFVFAKVFGREHLYEASLGGLTVVRQIFANDLFGMQHQAFGEYTPDGAWLFFNGRNDGVNFAIWRADPDGGTPVRVGPTVGGTGSPDIMWRISPSPSGDRVAFVRGSESGAEVAVLDGASATVLPWAVPGQWPQWSPTEDQIAFVEERGGAILVVNGDGSGLRQVTEVGRVYREASFTWSPDGQWLVARASGFEEIPHDHLDIINATTGLTLPLAFTGGVHDPAWRP